MSKIHTSFRNYGTVNKITIGEFNVNHRKALLFGTELHRFGSNKGYLISDKQIVPPDTFKFYSAAHDTVSWLDHVLCCTSMHQSIIDMTVLYEIMTSDHFSVATFCKMEGLTETCPADENDSIVSYIR